MRNISFIKSVFIISALIYGVLLLLNAIVKPKNGWDHHQVEYNNFPVLVAHRGGRGIYAENTLEAMKISYYKYHVDLLECDIQMTKDNKFVLLHDYWLNRTTNIKGQVKDFTLAELKKVDAGYWFTEDGKTYPLRGKGITMTTLNELLDEFYGKDVRISIELKDKVSASVDLLIQELKKYPNINKQVCIDCSYHPMQVYFRQQVGNMYCTENDEVEGLSMGLAGALGLSRLYYFLNPNNVEYFFAPYLSMKGFDVLSDGFYKVLQDELDAPFMYFTVNNEIEMARAIGLGAKGILTDRPDVAHKVFVALGLRNDVVNNTKENEHYHVPSARTSWEFSNQAMKILETAGGLLPKEVLSFIVISIPVTILLAIYSIIAFIVSIIYNILCCRKSKKNKTN
ncbi:hypothetical protein ENUP19_0275G0022 [Entamoeba nuttalli]|uniref:Glycerophosphoryl diester phosphodiesterase, putative n=2 Tax=Entamoeba nuttalli TaxID=412467 RepID=K2GC18_ENTNP|nr:glycerophosphoryl diester phosphodiesterase, putative [Entamoeba nuttalli P19]EKE40086.1 glycerophosphoryl diester phosphodiesterase, putative [Entamoeba nuttalli P19]|eukprot:XP_008857581.1 glycerophosphoryl diester phosphodiesterase, putative [Entamoeba nuttalli P19]